MASLPAEHSTTTPLASSDALNRPAPNVAVSSLLLIHDDSKVKDGNKTSNTNIQLMNIMINSHGKEFCTFVVEFR